MSKVGKVTYEVKVKTGFWFKLRLWIVKHLLYVKYEIGDLKESKDN